MSTKPLEVKLAETYSDLGYDDVLILHPKTFSDLLTDKRIELIEQLIDNDVESIRALAEKVGREPSAVHRDLGELFEVDLVGFEEDGNKKQPVLKHDCVTVYPFQMAENTDNKTTETGEGGE